MPEEIAGSRAADQAGSVFQRTVSAPSVTPEVINKSFGTFRESLGDLGKDKSLEPIKDFTGAIKSLVDAQKLIGGSLRLPKKDAKPEDKQTAIKEIMGKLRSEGILESIPESWEKYEIKTPAEEGFKVNQPLLDAFRQTGHKVGITPTQAQEIFDWYLNFQSEATAQEEKEFEDLKRGLKKEYGGLHSRKMEAARRAVGKYLGEDGDALISGLSPSAGVRFVKAFAEIGEPMLEDADIGRGEIPEYATLDKIKTQINTMMNDKKGPLWDVSHAGHKDAVEEWTKLQRVYIQLGGK